MHWFYLSEARTLTKVARDAEADSLYETVANTLAASPGESRAAAQVLREWAGSLAFRRRWDQAASCYQRAWALDRHAGSSGLALALNLTGLGNVISWSGGGTEPDAFFRRVLAIRRRLAPGSADIASTWLDRGLDALGNGLYRTARRRFGHAVSIMSHVSRNRLYLAEKLLYLGIADFALGQIDKAQETWTRSLVLAEQEAPVDLVTSASLQGLGQVAMKKGKWVQAEGFLTRSLSEGRELALKPMSLADVLQDLGAVEHRMGKKAESATHLCRSLDLVEQQRKRLEGNQDAQLRWGYLFADLYRDCAQSLVETGEAQKALGILESGRSRAALDRLGEAPRTNAKLTPDQALEWRRLTIKYDQVQREIEKSLFRKAPMQKVWLLEGRLREIRRRRERILSENRHLEATAYPEPLGLAGVGRELDPGTTLVFFATPVEQTLMFVVAPESQSPQSLAVFQIPLGREALRKLIDSFRDLLVNNRFSTNEIQTQGRQLYELLFRPADSLLAGGERLLIIPDGPLHVLPFAALIRDGHYLAEWKPLHLAASATAYAEQMRRRRLADDPAGKRLVAFGDPTYRGPNVETAAVFDPALRSVLRRGLSSLPASRREVEEIAAFFPRSQTYTGAAATEQQVKQLGSEVDILHFAVHGLLNERTPQNSALALSPPRPGESDNGLLQAWEIMQDLNLDADLVTLSACDTALGKEMGGEGLLGLTRAFQLAGARSVLATLWGVSDRPAASLMVSFYKALRAGKSKDKALQQAQVEQIRAGREPFYWATYQLYGDWR